MKARVTLILCVVLALVLIAACGREIATPDEPAVSPADSVSPAGSAYQKITADDARELLENGTAMTLVDVRRADEYEAAHIPGAVNVPNESIESTQPDALPDLQQTVVVYCRTGVRSKQAADKLVDMGYTDVRDMGGIVDWPYDTVSGTEPGEYVAGDTAPAGILSSFSATDTDGNAVDQSIFADYDVTMVNMWATYCGPCLSEMPDLGELAEEYEDQGVRIVGMVTDVLNYDGSVSDRQLDTARDIIAQTGAEYLHIVPSEDLYYLLSQVTAVPMTLFVDADGVQVGSAYLGTRSKAEWSDIITQMLEDVRK